MVWLYSAVKVDTKQDVSSTVILIMTVIAVVYSGGNIMNTEISTTLPSENNARSRTYDIKINNDDNEFYSSPISCYNAQF